MERLTRKEHSLPKGKNNIEEKRKAELNEGKEGRKRRKLY